MKFLEGMDKAAADDHWTNVHGPIFHGLPIERYVQNHVVGPVGADGDSDAEIGFDGFSDAGSPTRRSSSRPCSRTPGHARSPTSRTSSTGPRCGARRCGRTWSWRVSSCAEPPNTTTWYRRAAGTTAPLLTADQARIQVSQANIPRIERQDDLKLSTLERYIEALGGRLEVRAIFGDEHVVLLGGDGRGEP